jgi:hypothetical protein
VLRDAQAAARRDCGNCLIGPIKHDRFVSVAHKFGDGAERAEAPCNLAVGDLFGKKIQEICHWAYGTGQIQKAMPTRERSHYGVYKA